MEGFKRFLLRGNVVDLAVAVVIGAAFTLIVTAFVTGIITPLVGLLGGGAAVDGYVLNLGDAVFRYGAVLAAAINFVIVAAVIYFLVVVPVNRLMARYKTEPDVPAPTKTCPECLSSIPVDARRCAFCTSQVATAGR